MATKTDFLGTGWGFPPEFDNTTQSVVMVADDTDIRQSLLLLLNTKQGERVMLPDFGCNLNEFLFQAMDASTVRFMQDMITNAILKYESRINVNDLTIDTSDIVDGYVLIDLAYTVRTTNNRNNIVFPFYLNEGTLVGN
jgi:phage baseplate assembly protein W